MTIKDIEEYDIQFGEIGISAFVVDITEDGWVTISNVCPKKDCVYHNEKEDFRLCIKFDLECEWGKREFEYIKTLVQNDEHASIDVNLNLGVSGIHVLNTP